MFYKAALSLYIYILSMNQALFKFNFKKYLYYIKCAPFCTFLQNCKKVKNSFSIV